LEVALPTPEPIARQRLVAILVADAAGYSRLMALDDRATVRALDVARGVFRDRVAAHEGRIVDMAGDSVLAIFSTAIGALRAALDAQERLAVAELSVTPGERMRYRIGVHLGDVIEKDDGTVYGDGVNIAARLEGLAEPGGIAVSQSIESSINHRLNVRFIDIGPQQVKNIAQPIRAFRCEPAIGTTDVSVLGGGVSANTEAARYERKRRMRFRWFALIVALIGAGLIATRYVHLVNSAEPTNVADRRMTFGLTEFTTTADDALAKQVAKGIFSQIFWELGFLAERRPVWVEIMAKNVPLVAATADPKEIGGVLSVRFLIRGSITQQSLGYKAEILLFDASTGQILESRVVTVPPGRTTPMRNADIRDAIDQLLHRALMAEVELLRDRPTETLDARDLAFRAYVDWAHARPEEAKAAYEASSKLLGRALALAPESLPALYVSAVINLCRCIASWSDDVRIQEAIGIQAVEKFLRLQRHTSVLFLKGEFEYRHGRFDEALKVAELALESDSKNRTGRLLKTAALMRLGRLEKALEASSQQLALEDGDARVAALAAAVHYRAKNYAEAAALSRKAIAGMQAPEPPETVPGSVALTLIAAEAQLGQKERAAAAWREFNARVPQATTVASIRSWLSPEADLSDHEPLFDGLRRAGVPE